MDMTILKRLLAAILPFLLCATLAAAETEQRVALVVGNANYLTVGKLKNPSNDAEAMAEMLRRAGFEVIEREDVTRRTMIQAARTFAERLSPGGVGMFFYAGHGIQAQGVNYLVPVDAVLAVEDDLKYEAFDLQDILNKLDDARVRLSLVVLDACRDNPFAKSFRSTTHGLAQIDPPRGTVIAYSTAPGKVAADGDGNNSIYTAELLKAMSEPGRKLQDVFDRVTDAVEQRTNNAQTPWTNSSFRGDFYFLGPATVTVTPQPDPATIPLAAEIVFWQSIANSTIPGDFEAYLAAFPKGSFVPLARNRLAALSHPPAESSAKSSAITSPEAQSPPLTRQKQVTADAVPAQKAPASPKAAPPATLASPKPPHVAPTQQPTVPPVPATAAYPPPQNSPPKPPPVIEAPSAQPTQEAMVRPPPAGVIVPAAPDATAAAPPEPHRAARYCNIPRFNGMDSGAGGYAAIKLVNTGDRCGGEVLYRMGQPFDSLSVSTPPQHGSVIIEGSSFYYTPVAGFAGKDEFAIVSSPWGHFKAVVTVLPP